MGRFVGLKDTVLYAGKRLWRRRVIWNDDFKGFRRLCASRRVQICIVKTRMRVAETDPTEP